MPLSDEERKQLEELEEELKVEDPGLARELLTGWVPALTAHTVLGTVAAFVGVLVLILGVASQFTVIGVIGFLLMGAGAYLILGKHRFPGGQD